MLSMLQVWSRCELRAARGRERVLYLSHVHHRKRRACRRRLRVSAGLGGGERTCLRASEEQGGLGRSAWRFMLWRWFGQVASLPAQADAKAVPRTFKAGTPAAGCLSPQLKTSM